MTEEEAPPSVDQDASTIKRPAAAEPEVAEGGTVRMATSDDAVLKPVPILDVEGSYDGPPPQAPDDEPATTVQVDDAPPDGAADTLLDGGEDNRLVSSPSEHPPPDTEPEAPGASTPWVRRLAQGLVVVGLLLSIAFGTDPLVRRLIRQEAEANGVVLLELEDWHLSSWSLRGPQAVTLSGVAFALDGVAGVEGTVEGIEVSLDGTKATALTAQAPTLELAGSATSLALAFSVWTSLHPGLLQVPAEARDMTLRWRPQTGADPWLLAEGASVLPEPHGGRWVSEHTLAFGVDVGRVGAKWDGAAAEVKLGFGEDELQAAPVSITVRPTEASADVTLRKSSLKSLAGPMALMLPVSDVSVAGTAKLKMGTGTEITGSTEWTFEGYRVPVPPELKGIVFGDETTVSSDVAIRIDRGRITLSDMVVKHGALTLKGEGLIEREGDDATATCTLKGNISCAELVAAATRSKVAGDLGRMLAGLAGQATEGSVGITLDIEASTANLLGAKLERKIGIGCGLKPGLGLPLPTLDDLKDKIPPELRDRLPPELKDQLPPELR